MPISDLTGTSWRFDRTTLPYTSAGTEYQIDGKIITANHEYNLSGRMGESSNGLIYAPLNSAGNFAWVGYNVTVDQDSFTDDWQVYDHEDREPLEEALDGFDMVISGGSDVTNATLIAWLEQNAINITPVVDPTVVFDLDSLELPAGTYTITVKSKTTVSGYSESAASNSVSYVVTPPGYDVRVVGTVGNSSRFKFYDGQDNTGELLATFEQPAYGEESFDSTLHVDSGYLYVEEGGGGAQSLTYGTPSAGITNDGDGLYTVAANGSITGFYRYGCFAAGTKISLANGSTKNVEDISYDDDLLVYNFYEGRLDHAKPIWIAEERTASQYKKVTLSDGTVLKLVGPGEKCHRLFSVTKQKMIYANECVGDEVYKQDGSIVRVLSCEPVNEEVKYYNLTTEKYLDCFAEGVLTGSRLNNMYHILNMRYDSNERLISEEEEAERWAIREKTKKKK